MNHVYDDRICPESLWCDNWFYYTDAISDNKTLVIDYYHPANYYPALVNYYAVTQTGWWVSWCYPNEKIQDGYYDDVPDFKHMNPCAVRLVDKQNRMEFVKSAVKNFEEPLIF